MQRIDTSAWNLSLTWVLPLTIGCGPIVVAIDDGSTSTDPALPDPTDPSEPTIPNPTGALGECSYARPCEYGYSCVDGRCQPAPYCDDGGCCYGELGGCCYGDEGGCPQCYTLLDCGPAQHCYAGNCEAGSSLPYCDVAPELVSQLIPVRTGGIVQLAFVDNAPPMGDDLLIGAYVGVIRTSSPLSEQSVISGSVPGGAIGLASGDVDGDGDDDVMADLVFRYGILTGLRNDGGGEFTDASEEVTYSRLLELADVDADGITDRVGVFPLGGPFDQLAVARGHGDFQYDAATVYATPSPPLSVAVGVLGGPGASVVAFDGDNTLIWNSGAIVDAPAYWFTGIGGVGTGELAIGDFDGDGRPDIVRIVALAGWTMIDVLHAFDGGFETTYTSMLPGMYFHAATVEVDGDGLDDLVLSDAVTSLAVLHGTAWSFEQPFACVTSHAGNVLGAVDLAVGDYDGDGRDEIAVADSTTVAVHRVVD